MQKNHKDMDQLVRRLQEQTSGRLGIIEDQLNTLQTQSTSTQQLVSGVGWIITNRSDNIISLINQLGLNMWKGSAVLLSVGSAALQSVLRVQNLIARPARPMSEGGFFVLVDYMGTQSVVTFSYIDSWDAFDGSLEGKFKGKKGGKRVAQRRFLLQDPEGGQKIDRDLDWKKAIVPGQKVDMSLICELTEDEDDNKGKTLRCPFCKAANEGAPGQFLKW
jgi:hypothetical protein